MGIIFEGLIGLVLGTYMFGYIGSAFYYWAKRTDPHDAPASRRVAAAMMAFAWPYDVFVWLRDRDQA